LFVSYMQAGQVSRAQRGQCPTCQQRYYPAAQAAIFRGVVQALRVHDRVRLAFALQLGEVLAKDALAEDAEARMVLQAVAADRLADGMTRCRARKALAKVLIRSGQLNEAERMLTDCLHYFLSQEAESRLDCRWAGGTRQNLARILEARGEHELAAQQMNVVVSKYRQERGDSDRDTLNAVAALGGALLSAGRLEEARSAVAHAVSLGERLLGPEHDDVVSMHKVIQASHVGEIVSV